MNFDLRWLLIACAITLSGCSERAADFERDIASPSNKTVARLSGYQPRGTIDGYLTVSFMRRSEKAKAQIVLGHMIGVKAGWLDEHTFAFVYDLLEQRTFASPVYVNGEAASEVQIISCNQRYLNCAPILQRLVPLHSMAVPQFPEGSWPSEQNFR